MQKRVAPSNDYTICDNSCHASFYLMRYIVNNVISFSLQCDHNEVALLFFTQWHFNHGAICVSLPLILRKLFSHLVVTLCVPNVIQKRWLELQISVRNVVNPAVPSSLM